MSVTGLGGVLQNLQSLADSTQWTDTLMLASIHLDLASGDEDFVLTDTAALELTPIDENTAPSDLDDNMVEIPSHHCGRMGDPLARCAEQALLKGVLYPGDHSEMSSDPLRERFMVYRTSTTHHVICDGWHCRDPDDEMLVCSDLLLSSEFNLGDWYAAHLVKDGHAYRRRGVQSALQSKESVRPTSALVRKNQRI